MKDFDSYLANIKRFMATYTRGQTALTPSI